MEAELKNKIKEQISNFKSADDIYSLFKLLKYPILDTSYKRKKGTFDLKKEDAERIKEIYSVSSFGDGDDFNNLNIFLIETKTTTNEFIRRVTTKFNRQYPYALLIFAKEYSKEVIIVFPKLELIEVGKHKLNLVKLVLNSKATHYTDVDTLSKICYENERRPRRIWRKIRNAFSVKKVTEAFFQDYTKIFFNLRADFISQGISQKEAHEFTLQFLNRIMFIYFISKKRWLNDDLKFMQYFWTQYKILDNSSGFYNSWLTELFFKSFNNKSELIEGIPEDIKKIISNLPFLNGGLFKKNTLDELNISIGDETFKEVFEFFEKYNFTIKEDMPLDNEVAVDPQMIGYVYESLANVADEIYDRNDLGIFYTPRVEVDFMCRRSLVEYLTNNMESVPKEEIYYFIFEIHNEDKRIKYFNDNKLWDDLSNALNNLSVVDPACGSGAFLVGMLNLLSELYRILNRKLGIKNSDFEMKYRIIQRSLYGVDVMPWAVHAAELRLWLQLIVETPFKEEDLTSKPLLPNLNMNLRIGDSLVQEIGGINLNLRENVLSDELRGELSQLEIEKKKFFENPEKTRFNTVKKFEVEEVRLFQMIINERITKIHKEQKSAQRLLSKSKDKQAGLFGNAKETTKADANREIKKSQLFEFIKQTNEEISQLKDVSDNLADAKIENKPFVWDIDFSEIFMEKDGFDIVIGNPPYVAYKKISPPNILKENLKNEDRTTYKRKLIKSVKSKFPIINKINGMSDYYIYFYFHGLSLLNKKGVFCFITSNFWLDVDYGASLQEFLLKYVPIYAIYDNQSKKSFEHANINTVITLFGPPKIREGFFRDESWTMLDNSAQFVIFKRPFDEVANARTLINIEKIKFNINHSKPFSNHSKEDYKVFSALQKFLLEDGWKYPKNYDKLNEKFKKGSYIGNKWGGKYLRAPNIFFNLVANPKIVKLGTKSKIITGLKEGGYKKYMKPVSEVSPNNNFIKILKNVKSLENINININDSMIVERIEHFKKSVKDKNSPILWLAMRGQKHICYYNPNHFPFTGNFFGIEPVVKNDIIPLILILNSTLISLFFEILARKGFGGGSAIMVKSDLENHMMILDPSFLDNSEVKRIFNQISGRKMNSIFYETGLDPSRPIREQKPNPLPDRRELDNMIFDQLGLDDDNRNEVYWSVCELVKQRIDKAKSLKKGD